MTVINRNNGHPVWDTLTIAKTKDMVVGTLCVVLGEPTKLDGNGLIYSVVANGSGGIAMSNGNELLQYTGTASTIDKQTSDSDADLDKAVLTDSLGDNGGPIYTEANYQPGEPSGLNIARLMYNASGGTVGVGAVIAGSSLRHVNVNAGGVIANTGVAAIGTWKQVQDGTFSTASAFMSYFARIS